MIKDRLIEANTVKHGKFQLASGKNSKYYVDIKDITANPIILAEITAEISKRISARKIAGVELGAVPLLAAVSLELNIPYVIIRKDVREHGIDKQFIGIILPDEEIDVIEDVITTGNSVLKAVDMMRKNGAKISKVICVVDREEGGREALNKEGLELLTLVRLSELIKLKR